MKTCWRIFVVAVMLALLGLSSSPAAADDGVAVSGICWFLEEPESPDIRIWYTGPEEMMYHVRDEKQLMDCDFTDDRLDGLMLLTVNWDVVFTGDPLYWVTGHDHGGILATDMDGNATWEGRYNNFIDETSTLYGTTHLNGVGEYQNLHFDGTIYFSFTGVPDWAVHMEGVIK